MASEAREQGRRDIVLPPGAFVYTQDTSKGFLKVYTGANAINPTAQETPIVYEPVKGEFQSCISLEAAVRRYPIAVEGYYILLFNPEHTNKHPDDGAAQQSVDLSIGSKIVIPGPATFALWPGQRAKVIKGHHLRSNQYLLVRVYNEEEARKNWNNAIIKPTSAGVPGVLVEPPSDLTVGKLLIIRGTEISFYIPPTGITVISDDLDDSKKEVYVRDALTLERLEYCILLDENGKKRYERGPQVVFPQPTEQFVEYKGSKKFRDIELNELQGLYVKVVAPYTENGIEYKEGQELFITGKDTAIYSPREEHVIVRYDGHDKHFATAIPPGEGRYLMDRLSGKVSLVRGSKMVLPDPRTEVFVRRVLSSKQCSLWYPTNKEAFEYNMELRKLLNTVPTTRSGAISEGDYERGIKKGARKTKEDVATNYIYAAGTGGTAVVPSVMASSQMGKEQFVAGDEFSRASTYTEPRALILDTNKYQGAPCIEVWTGYAVMIVSKENQDRRRIVQGPTSVLLEYDESLEVLELSTGKPKTTDNLLHTVYLRVLNNKVSDVFEVDTLDHVALSVYMSYRVNFEGDNSKWFNIENYVKFLCDHVRSVVRGAIKKIPVEEFYLNYMEILHDLILGKLENGVRPGMLFVENGMHVLDVEILRVKIVDDKIRHMLDVAQQEVIQSNVELSNAKRNLEMVKQKEKFACEELKTRADTDKLTNLLKGEAFLRDASLVAAQLEIELNKVMATQKVVIEQQKNQDINFDSDLDRNKRKRDWEINVKKQHQDLDRVMLVEETNAVVKRFEVAQTGFSEALRQLSSEETLIKVAEAWSIQRIIGGENVIDAVKKVFSGTKLASILPEVSNNKYK